MTTIPADESLFFFLAFGCLTSLSGRAPAEKTVNLREALKHLSKSTGLTESQLILRWAFDRTNGVVVTSTSKMQRAQDAMDVLTGKQLEEDDLRTIEEAALKDGYEGQRVSWFSAFVMIKSLLKEELYLPGSATLTLTCRKHKSQHF